MTLTLWDLIEPIRKRFRPERPAAAAPDKHPLLPPPPPPSSPSPAPPSPRAPRPAPRPSGKAPPRRAAVRSASSPAAPGGMQAKYDAVVKRMLDEHHVRVRKWRTSMSGIAWYVTYRDGHIQRLIESPKPKGPMSVAVFLHEIGHHAIGFDVYKPRCLEEYHAWRWALEAMEAHDLNITDAVRLRMHRSLWYAVQKAKRRGIKKVPDELTPFLVKPPSRRRRA